MKEPKYPKNFDFLHYIFDKLTFYDCGDIINQRMTYKFYKNIEV